MTKTKVNQEPEIVVTRAPLSLFFEVRRSEPVGPRRVFVQVSHNGWGDAVVTFSQFCETAVFQERFEGSNSPAPKLKSFVRRCVREHTKEWFAPPKRDLYAALAIINREIDDFWRDPNVTQVA